MLWVIFICGMLLGVFGGGWRSLRLARQGQLKDATRALRRAALVAAVCGMALTVPVLGWPFKDVSKSVPEEVSKTVIETIQVPVQATWWFFWQTTKMETREVPKTVTETVSHTETTWEFSPWLFIPMAGVGCLCYFLEMWGVFLIWRWFG